MNKEFSTMRRYLAVFLPLYPAERLIRARGQAPDTPFTLVEKQRGSMRLVACDAAALALGLAPGLTLADARARVPELLAFDHDPHADRLLLAWLANGCERYTPGCAVDPPQGLILDITGCTHLFEGDEIALAVDLQRRLRRHGFTARTALGATPDSARAKARFGVSAIGDLPVEALDMDAGTHQALRRSGLRYIGDLANRPCQPLAARFGKACTLKLARLLEEEDPHITPRRVPPVIRVERNFAEPVARTEHVLAVIGQLADESAEILRERGKGGRRFEVSLFRSDGHVARLAVDTGTPTRDSALLDRLIRERIDTLADPLDPGFGYDMIRLAVPVAEALANTQMGLETKVDTKAANAALIDRLSVRLGTERVRHFHSHESHIPERAVAERAALSGPPTGEWPKPETGEPPPRPFRLFDPPQPIDVTAEIPDGPPHQFRWRRKLHQVTRYEGPERIAAEWWRHKGGYELGGGGLTRDYYRVEDNEGRRFWVFRHGLYGQEKADPGWYLHGLFA
ncbi:MAG: DNA polymerase Y family protein [Sphingorhabdus sp.]